MSLLKDISDLDVLQSSLKSVKNAKTVAKRNKSRGVDGQTISQFLILNGKNDLELRKISKELLSGRYKIEKLKGIKISKPDSDLDRLILAPTVKDRVIHRAIFLVIEKYIRNYINTGISYCGINDPSKTRKYNSNTAINLFIQHIKNRNLHVFKTDIDGFFDNVSKRKILNKVRKLLPDDSIDHLLKDIIYFKIDNIEELKKDPRIRNLDRINTHGIPQGSTLSPILSNIYLADFDRKLCKRYGDKIIRYVDDIVLLSKNEIGESVKRYIIKTLSELSLKISLKKTFDDKNLLKDSVNFLGINFSKDKITYKYGFSEFREKRLRQMMSIYSDKYRDKDLDFKNVSHLREINEKMNKSILGWVNFVERYHMRKYFKKINEEIKLENKKRKLNRRNYLNKFELNLIPSKFINRESMVSKREWQSYFQ